MVVEYSSKVIVSKYLMDILKSKSKVYTARLDLINNHTNNNVLLLNMFKSSHRIQSNDELNKFIHDAKLYIALIKGDIYKRLTKLSEKDLMNLLNKPKITDRFLRKYIPTEEELKNDIFLQCG